MCLARTQLIMQLIMLESVLSLITNSVTAQHMQMQQFDNLHRSRFACTHLSLSQVLGGVSIAHISAEASGDAQQVTLGVILVVSHPPAGEPCCPLIP